MQLITVSKCIKQKLIEPKGEIEKCTLVCGDLNSSLTVTDKKSKA